MSGGRNGVAQNASPAAAAISRTGLESGWENQKAAMDIGMSCLQFRGMVEVVEHAEEAGGREQAGGAGMLTAMQRQRPAASSARAQPHEHTQAALS